MIMFKSIWKCDGIETFFHFKALGLPPDPPDLGKLAKDAIISTSSFFKNKRPPFEMTNEVTSRFKFCIRFIVFRVWYQFFLVWVGRMGASRANNRVPFRTSAECERDFGFSGQYFLRDGFERWYGEDLESKGYDLKSKPLFHGYLSAAEGIRSLCDRLWFFVQRCLRGFRRLCARL